MKRMIFVACMIIGMLISIFGLGKYCTDVNHFQKTIESLDEKKDNVLALTGGTTGLSIAITCIPGDIATPIAEKLADLSGVFLVILCAIFLEKYMITITGLITFKYLLPIAFALFGVNQFLRNATINKLAMRLMLLGIAMFAIVPVSVNISNVIEKTYDVSVKETIDEMEKLSEEITGAGTETTSVVESTVEDAVEENKSIWDKVVDKFDDVKENATNAMEKVENTISKAKSGELMMQAKDQLNKIIEAAAVMLITSCVIPVLIIVAFGWIVRMLLEVDINFSSIGKKLFPGK